MTSKGIDCATPLTAGIAADLAAAGYSFAARYLVPPGYAKRLTRAEAEAITAAGMRIVSVFETSANRPAGGAVAGAADGAAAFREAQAIGQPPGSAIYFAVDYDAQQADFDSIEQYLRAAAGRIPGYRAGVYGSYAVIEEMARRKAALHFWQTYAWSGGRQSACANLYQYSNNQSAAGIAVDLNIGCEGEGWWSTAQEQSASAGTEAAIGGVKIVVNDKLVAMGDIAGGRVVAPLAAVLGALGTTYKFDNDTKKLYIYT